MHYTGIGSRETPADILTVMEEAGYRLARMGACLRSGKALGADSAFQLGVQRYCEQSGASLSGMAEIYKPWRKYTGDTRLWNSWDINLEDIDSEFPYHAGMRWEWVQEVCPHWERLKQGPRKMHERNVHQVFGKNLSDAYLKASRFVVYYAPEDKHGNPKGGTATAVNLAKKTGIRTLNLWKPDNVQVLNDFLKSMEMKRGL